jgi:acyl-coenzyme A thioesterase PaaI-like protein
VAEAAGRDPFSPPPPPAWDGGEAYTTLLRSFRRLQDLVGGSNPPADEMRAVTEGLDAIVARLEPWTCGEAELIAGRRADLPGRGHPLLPPFVFDEQTDRSERGRVTFTQYYLGGNGAAHGGALPLFFDDVLGRLSNANGRSIARTAYLHVNYRHITPVGRELDFEATVDREDGRKRYVTGRLFDSGTLIADAEGLFVELLPGQP